MNLEIESQDVVRLVLQFLKENNLTSSMRALQSEAAVSLNTVDNLEHFVGDIHAGKWDAVLAQVSSMQLPRDKLIAVYEQVFLELLEAGEKDLAKEILRTTEPMEFLKADNHDRYLKLEHLLLRPYFAAAEAYEMGSSKERRRQEIAEQLATEVSVVPPSRLLSLLGQALRFQQAQGILPKGASIDLFRGGNRTARKDQDDKIPRRQAGLIKFSPESHPETVCFSPDGVSMVTGSADGFIEVWDFDSCKLRTDLEYQAKDELMMHAGQPIMCSAFSRDGKLLATGAGNGEVKVWKVATGERVGKFTRAHSQGVTSVAFSRDSFQVLTTSFDSLVRIHGLKSEKMLKEFRGHSSFVNSALYSKDGTQVLSASSDGSCRLWDIRTSDCLISFRPGLSVSSMSSEVTVFSVQLMPNNPEQVLVGVKASQALLMTLQGQLLRTLSSGKSTGGDFVCVSVSPQGKWIYCMGEDGVLYIFDSLTGQLENVLEVSSPPPTGTASAAGNEVIGMSHHPSRNLIASITDDGTLKTWKP